MSNEAEEFLSFSYKINEFISATMLGLEMNVENYDRKLIWDNIINKGIQVRPFPFNGVARHSISGMIVKDNEETTLTYNSNMSLKRQNFTISHELTHFLYHLDDENHFFTDSKSTLNYSSSDMLLEFQANIGASAILLPDPVFIHELKKGSSIGQLSNKYCISESAIYVRLLQTMQGHFEANYDAATKTATKIMKGRAKVSMRQLGCNLENKIIYINPFYEAICV